MNVVALLQLTYIRESAHIAATVVLQAHNFFLLRSERRH